MVCMLRPISFRHIERLSINVLANCLDSHLEQKLKVFLHCENQPLFSFGELPFPQCMRKNNHSFIVYLRGLVFGPVKILTLQKIILSRLSLLKRHRSCLGLKNVSVQNCCGSFKLSLDITTSVRYFTFLSSFIKIF